VYVDLDISRICQLSIYVFWVLHSFQLENFRPRKLYLLGNIYMDTTLSCCLPIPKLFLVYFHPKAHSPYKSLFLEVF